MKILEITFWLCLFLVFYAYIGYGILLFALVRIKRMFGKTGKTVEQNYEPDVTLFVAAYNEKDYVDSKISFG
jgi:cellulose synthase/poly-beta-1,6-N-acetylglucosamine synthase-like glycosyltransferase